MDEERFSQVMRSMKFMKSNNPDFQVEKFLNFSELSEEQKMQVEKDFGRKKKIWVENSLYYNYYDNDSF